MSSRKNRSASRGRDASVKERRGGRPQGVKAAQADLRLPPAATPLAACFFLSGAASLVLEVVWGRQLRLVFGSTTLAISTVLVAYMLGLGVGGLVGGRIAQRFANGVKAYGWFELIIGAYALFVLLIFGVLPSLSAQLLSGMGFWPLALTRFVIVLGVLLLPTLLMGATLPVLTTALTRRNTAIASRVGLLYGINTLGAVSGVFLATFVLLPAVGVWMTNLVGAGLAMVVGVIAIFMVAPRVAPAAANAPVAPSTRAAAPDAEAPERRWNPLLLSYALVGFTALAYEVCWTRALAMILGSSIYAFATMLAAFLTGIAFGSLLARRWSERVRDPAEAYALGVGLLGVCALGTVLAFGMLPDLFVALIGRLGTSASGVGGVNIAISILAMSAPTLVLGALFPLLLRATAEGREPSRVVGDVYFANTIGSASGAFAAGFVLIPALGLPRTMGLCIGINLAVSATLLLTRPRWRVWPRAAVAGTALAGALAVMVVPPVWRPMELIRGVYQLRGSTDEGVDQLPLVGMDERTLLYYREGINTTISVDFIEGQYVLRVNGKPDASSYWDMQTQLLLGHVPMLFGSRPQQVLVIGLGSGVTVGAVALHEPEQVDVIELEPAVIEASRFFDEFSHRPLDRPFVRVIPDDGRVYLSHTQQKYDLIISEPSNPWITGVSNLFTREFFQAARRALNPGGQLFQWVQLYGLAPDTTASILAALQSEFPHVYGFSVGDGIGDLMLMASATPLTGADFPRWESVPLAVRNDLTRINIVSTADIWSLLRLTSDDVRALASKAPAVNSDDNMYVELRAPLALHDTTTVEANHERFAPFTGGALTVAEQNGVRIDAEQVAELAHSYIAARSQPAIARVLVDDAHARGAKGTALTVEALLLPEDEAITVGPMLDLALEIEPGTVLARELRAYVRLEQENYEDALADVDAVLLHRPERAASRYARVKALVELGRMEEARIEADRLMALLYHQQEYELLWYAGRAAAALDQHDTAIRQMREYIEHQSSDATAWSALAEVYAAKGDEPLAEEARVNAERSRINSIRNLWASAEKSERAGEYYAAITFLEALLFSDPDDQRAQQALARLKARVAQ